MTDRAEPTLTHVRTDHAITNVRNSPIAASPPQTWSSCARLFDLGDADVVAAQLDHMPDGEPCLLLSRWSGGALTEVRQGAPISPELREGLSPEDYLERQLAGLERIHVVGLVDAWERMASAKAQACAVVAHG